MSQPTTRTSTTESFTIVEKSRNSDMTVSVGSYASVADALAVIRENPEEFGKIGEVSIVQSTVTTVITSTKKTVLIALPV